MFKPALDKNCNEDCLIKHALSGLCVGLILTNGDGKVTWLNRVAAHVLGLPESECLGRPLHQLLKDLQLAAFWQEAADTDGNMVGDIAVRWPEKLWLKLNATRYLDANGDEIGRALLFCDVTAERDVQIKLSQEVAERLVTLSEDVATRLLSLTSSHMAMKPASHLTRQELRILRLVGGGAGNDEIADELCVATSTVRSHLKQIYRKLELRSRSEAISYAARNRLV